MTDILQAGIAWLAGELKANASQPVTYSRGYDSVDLQACYGAKLLRLDDGFGNIRLEWTDLDLVIPDVSDFHFGDGVMIEPERGDQVFIVIGDQVQTFQAEPYGGDPVWRWCDPYQTSIRIHTKHIATEAYY